MLHAFCNALCCKPKAQTTHNLQVTIKKSNTFRFKREPLWKFFWFAEGISKGLQKSVYTQTARHRDDLVANALGTHLALKH